MACRQRYCIVMVVYCIISYIYSKLLILTPKISAIFRVSLTITRTIFYIVSSISILSRASVYYLGALKLWGESSLRLPTCFPTPGAKRDMSRYVATDSLIYQMQAQWYKRSMNRSSTTNTAICGSLWTEQGGEKVTLHIF